jgi:hypothetical protein
MAGLVPAIDVFSRFATVKTWMPGTRPGMTTSAAYSLRLRLGFLGDERRFQIVEKLNLHAIAMHDETLLGH